jgi:hypothetical protein
MDTPGNGVNTANTPHTLKMRLAAESVDRDGGLIRGCTVAQAGVEATGKFLMLDAKGERTFDPEQCVRELPVWTDEKTLDTLMAAAAAAPRRVKAREDHDDSIGARAGYAGVFRKLGADRVVADVKLYDNYRNRDLVLETIAETPDQIGLSIDFLPEFEIGVDKALMRVARLDAVDIVDEGAITHRGLFLSAGVDTGPKGSTAPGANNKPPSIMPEPVKPAEASANDQVLAAVGKLTETVTGCMAQMTAAITAMAKPAAAPAAESDGMRAVRSEMEKLAAAQTQLTTQLQSVQTENIRLKNERLLLGYRGSREQREKLGAAPEETIRMELAKQKSFPELCRAERDNLKCKAAEAAISVLRTEEGKAAYRAHLKNRGVIKPDDSN